MGKGLLLGAVLTSFVSLLLSLVSSFAPLWLVWREEVAENLCWWGEGVFTSRYWFGDDLNTLVPSKKCRDPLGLGPMSTFDAYCSANPAPVVDAKHDPTGYIQAMCNATNWSKATSVATIILISIGMVLGLILLHYPMLHRRAMSYGLIICMVLCWLQIGTSLGTWVLMTNSPLFSYKHKLALSENHDGIPFGRYASCSISSPFRQIPQSLFTPSSLQCLFPGPSYYAALFTGLMQLLAFTLYFYKRRELSERTFVSGVGDVRTTHESLLEELRKARVYSMYGSMARRTQTYRFQFVLITLIPFTLMVIHAMMWAGFVFWGMQTLVDMNISFVTTKRWENEDSYGGVEIDPASDTAAALLAALPDINTVLTRGNGVGGTHTLVEYTVNAFNFSPELAISYFINNGAALIGLLSFLAMFVLPITKSLAWVYLFFVPFDEGWKGWVLTLLDFSGKWQLAYMFIMTLQALGMGMHIRHSLPTLGGTILINVKMGTAWGGRGSALLIWACIGSLILGQAILLLHQKTVKWEERVRKERTVPNADQTEQVSPTGSSLLATPLMSSSYQQHSSSALNARSTSTERLNAIAQGEHCSSSNDDDDDEEEINKDAQVESMCDRVFEPECGVKLRWTTLGKSVWWFFLFLIGGTFTFAQLVELMVMRLTDMNVLILPNPADRIKRISVFTTVTEVLNTSVDTKPYDVCILMFVTLSLMPMVRLLAVAYLWVLPLTVRQQKRMFDFLEFSMAWASLEVYLVTMLAMVLQMPGLMGPLSGSMTPMATKVLLKIFPWMDGLMGAEMELRPGFWFVAVVVLLEKVVARLIMAQAVTAISERQLQGSLQQLDDNHAYSGAPLHTVHEDRFGDDAEHVLEAEAAAMFFSPAMRYNTPSMLFSRSYFYAGIPRHWWTDKLIKCGMLGEARLVEQFGTPSIARSLRATSSPRLLLGGEEDEE